MKKVISELRNYCLNRWPHDSERMNNAEDIDHGLRASKLIDTIRQTRLRYLNDEQIDFFPFARLAEVCRNERNFVTLQA